MDKQTRNVGRPALAEDEKLVQTTVRLLPSVRKVIELKAQCENKSLGEYLRGVAEQHVMDLEVA